MVGKRLTKHYDPLLFPLIALEVEGKPLSLKMLLVEDTGFRFSELGLSWNLPLCGYLAPTVAENAMQGNISPSQLKNLYTTNQQDKISVNAEQVAFTCWWQPTVL